MTKEEAIEKLKDCEFIGRGDPEAAHGDSDRVLCDFLKALGYSDVVEAFEMVKRWYA